MFGLAKGLGKGLPLAQTSIEPIMMTMDREVYAVSACVCVCLCSVCVCVCMLGMLYGPLPEPESINIPNHQSKRK